MVGKFLLVLTASLVTAALSVTSMGISSWFGIIRQFAGSAAREPQSALHFTIGLERRSFGFLCRAAAGGAFFSRRDDHRAFAKSYKEAQSYISPLMVMVIVPAMAAMLPGRTDAAALHHSLFVNVSLLCKELIAGTYHWNSIAVIFISTCVYALAAIFIAVKMFQRESVLFRS